METLPDLTMFQSPWKLASPCTPMTTRQPRYAPQTRHHPYGRGMGYEIPQQETIRLPQQIQHQFPSVSKLMNNVMYSHTELNTPAYSSSCYSDYMYPVYYTSYPYGYYQSSASNDNISPHEIQQPSAQIQPSVSSFMDYIPQFNEATFNTDMFKSFNLTDYDNINTDDQSNNTIKNEHIKKNILNEKSATAKLLKMFKPRKSAIEVSTKVSKKKVEYSVIKSTMGDKYQCTSCQTVFPSLETINEHCKSCSVQDRPYKCEFCDKKFKSSTTLRVHRRVHTGYKPYKCTHCGLCFSDNSTKTKHERIHTKNKPYQCDVCGYSFTQSGNLRRHRRNIHNLN